MTTTRIGLLSKSKDLHATRRLIEAGEAQGHRVDFLPILECVILSDSKGSALHVAGAPVGRPDVVIGRVGTFMTSLGLAALRAFERMGVPCVNSSDAMARSRDKQQTIERLTEGTVSSKQIGGHLV